MYVYFLQGYCHAQQQGVWSRFVLGGAIFGSRTRWLGNLGHFLSLLRNCCDLPIPVRGGCLFQIVRGTMYVCLTSYSFLKNVVGADCRDGGCVAMK